MAVVKVLEPRKNSSMRTGRHDPRPASLAASYYTWGRGKQRGEMRGEWYGPDGPQTWDEVNHWAREQSAQHPYTFKIILSAEAGAELDAQAWQRVMQRQTVFSQWRLITNTDTDNHHAHVIVFGDQVYGLKHDKILDRESFFPWWNGLKKAIAQEERQYHVEQERRQEQERLAELRRREEARERSLREIGL